MAKWNVAPFTNYAHQRPFSREECVEIHRKINNNELIYYREMNLVQPTTSVPRDEFKSHDDVVQAWNEVERLTNENELLKERQNATWAVCWTPIKKLPQAGHSYVIWANYQGIPTYDIAFYDGKKPDGTHRWIMGNIEIDHRNIEMWSALSSPEDAQSALEAIITKRVQTVSVVDCPCTKFDQGDECPVGKPSLLCDICKGKGQTSQEMIEALALEMMRIADDKGAMEDPFSVWESINTSEVDPVTDYWDDKAMYRTATGHTTDFSSTGRPFQSTHRHKKRGTEYREVARGKLQTDVPLTDYADLVAYHDVDGNWWFRTPKEFDDGRFEEIKEWSAVSQVNTDS